MAPVKMVQTKRTIDLTTRAVYPVGTPVFRRDNYPVQHGQLAIILPTSRTVVVDKSFVGEAVDPATAWTDFLEQKSSNYSLTTEQDIAVLVQPLPVQDVDWLKEGTYMVLHPGVTHAPEQITVYRSNGALYSLPAIDFDTPPDQNKAYRLFCATLLPGASIPGIDHANVAYERPDINPWTMM